ncbi:metallophosphoesterase [Psychrosphaera algicola]|uniref:Metallophosphoesterase n=1 Tax=Psychrosphaera algicola TaxID=3023714 RepID=A0ABT5FI12_9GAMM|nr:metallophosphoesterase [Psychrosphaera sp. G1-22]MDC2890833.1 metallophosphoesterase [Psychrosphaera sp. G1-22]
MADYFIGDIQGCYAGLRKALAVIEFNPAKDVLWLTGDLIARGEDSLAVLKYLYKNSDSVKTVLGNHDLHFIAVANGLKKPIRRTT